MTHAITINNLFTPWTMEQSESASDRRNLLFNVNQPFDLASGEFDKEWWPLVSNVWAKTSTNYLSSGDTWTVHVCRLSKPYRSSTRKEGVPSDKRRKTHARAAIPCAASIKVTKIASTERIRVERYKSTPDHTHTLDDVDKIKRPAIIRELIEEQASKHQSPPEIVAIVREIAQRKGLGEVAMHLHRDEVANIQRKHRITATATVTAITTPGPDSGAGTDGRSQLETTSKNRPRTFSSQDDTIPKGSESYRHERVKNLWESSSDSESGPSTREQGQGSENEEGIDHKQHHHHHQHRQHHSQQQQQQQSQHHHHHHHHNHQGQFHVLVPTPPCYPKRLDEILERLRNNFQSILDRGEDVGARTFLQDLENFVDSHS
ncbi:hypothetical protein B0O80DRAFT_523811 [Mortierella sp. GBAus27b]|nr:hypothetical protein B0O80DRAFT_523811 [Mortierella sp. GBAus27b]